MATILSTSEYEQPQAEQADPHKELTAWVMGRVEEWRDVRESTYRDRWDRYYHIWRGRWTSDSKTRKTERSKIIAPASQIAVDTAASELLEAIFAREQFVDISDDISDEQREDAILVRDRLIEDLREDDIVGTLAEICTLGALYGQFIAKIVTEVEEVSVPRRIQVTDEVTGVVREELKRVTEEKVKVYPVAIEPGHLVPDPSGTEIEYMLGAAHEFKMPLHLISERQAAGVYFDTPVSPTGTPDYSQDRSEEGYAFDRSSPAADVIEWHGRVPARLLTKINAKGDVVAEAIADSSTDEALIEAVVTIANGCILLRAIPNPSVMEDRAIVAEQFDVVPNRFWGRGVMEKGFNMQVSLDSELRARQDGLAWTNNPMMAGDISKLPPGSNLDVWPGKYWGTKGDPREALMPLQFGNIDTGTFQQAADLERMLQFATGAVDPSVLNAGTRDQATGASAVNVSGIVKRNKRTMLNMEVFLTKLIRGIVWRKMKFDPKRYPADYKLVVRGTVGIMAREVEQQFLLQMLQFSEQGRPEYAGILKLVLEQSANPNKAQLLKLLDAAMQGPSEEDQAKAQEMEQIQKQLLMVQLEKEQALAAKAQAEAMRAGAQANKIGVEADMIDDELQLGTVKATVDVKQAQNQERQIAVTERKQALDEEKFLRGE